uniref:Uncharacterized protein n=1 Tax=Peronospora matthiolae TaxID=2874970 RepID=A0AAV1TW11_9STRA
MLNCSHLLLVVVILVVFANSDGVLPPAAHALRRRTTTSTQVQTVESPVNGKQAVQSIKVARDATVEERAATCLSSLHEWLTASLKEVHGRLAWMKEVAVRQKVKAFWEKVKAFWETKESAISKRSKAAWLKEEEIDLKLWGSAPKRKEEGAADLKLWGPAPKRKEEGAADSKKSEPALGENQEGAVLNKAAAASVEEEEPFGWSNAGRWWENDAWMKNDVPWDKKRPTAE